MCSPVGLLTNAILPGIPLPSDCVPTIMHTTLSRLNRLIRLLISATLFMGAAASAESSSTQSAKGVLWEVKSATNTVYLFGSIHLAKANFYPLPPAVEAAYRQADTLAVEIDPTDATATAKAMPLLTYAAPDKLEKHLRPQTWGKLKSVAASAVDQLQVLRPAMLAAALTLQIFMAKGYEPGYGIDLHFINQAKVDHKKLVELESAEFQAGILGSLSDAEGDAMIAETLQELGNGELERESEALVDAWKSGNAPALEKLLRDFGNKDAGSKRLMKLLLDDRNVGMAHKITRLLEAKDKAFVVVGAGHLVGPNSITYLLGQQGLQIRRIE